MNSTVVDVFTASSGFGLLAIVAIKTTVVLTLGLLLWNSLGRASASARHLVLVTTLLAALVTPALALFMPALQIPVFSAAPQMQSQDAKLSTPNAPTLTEATTLVSDVSTRPDGVHQSDQAINVGTFAVAVFASLTLLLVLHLGLGIFQLWRISRNAREISHNDQWYSLVPSTFKGRVRLLQSHDLAAPCTWGFYKPVVVLPLAAEHWTQQNRKNALLHELSHVDRYDWLFQVLARLTCAIHWYNPLAWIVYRKLILEAERAADDRVLLSGSGAHDYAEQLVELTQLSHSGRVSPLAATTMASKSLLSDRVHSILNTGVQRMPLRTMRKFALMLSIATTTLAIGSTQLVTASSHSESARYDSADVSAVSPLIHAAATGNHAEVIRLIDAGSDVNKAFSRQHSTSHYQRTALTTAARAGHADVVKTLLDAGARIDRVVSGDATALIEALKANHVDVAQILIDRGADAGLTVEGDGSPLIAAAMANNVSMISQLLRKGADPDDWVRGDASAIYHAARNGNAELVQLLIDAGADVNMKMPGDGNALIIATRKGHTDVVRTLLDAGALADAGVRGDGNAMISAAQSGDTEALKLMITSGANVNASVKGDGSPLIAAARSGHTRAVNLLLRNGAEIDKVVYGDENALIGAAWAGDLEMVNLLLEAGANPNIKAETYGGNYRSALSQASLENHQDVVEVLKNAGARE